ncbi:YybH family protein [Muriicola marianensis]|uniref:DUF4440 domain-containing protein n=1 Tax=Muriicola marianensis TaxID=1324801 RepID=A0ABQ1R4C0_9FLAO|nr:DUF4440 domain-containing protein [Muriicola marianensis]GGD53524.1 hypothetical protein GCM10011361_20280 [Muriicola marianensis]
MKVLSSLFVLLLSCSLTAQNYSGNQEDIDQILENITDFSTAVMQSDYEAIAMAYTEDAKIFPNNRDILQGRDAILAYWTLPDGVQTPYHKITPVEIEILGDEAYDFGYYEGRTRRADGSEVGWKGKYVIVWKKIEQEWKIYLDIWNRIQD